MMVRLALWRVSTVGAVEEPLREPVRTAGVHRDDVGVREVQLEEDGTARGPAANDVRLGAATGQHLAPAAVDGPQLGQRRADVRPGRRTDRRLPRDDELERPVGPEPQPDSRPRVVAPRPEELRARLAPVADRRDLSGGLELVESGTGAEPERSDAV